MSAPRRVLVVVGTRPEAIKLAPLVRVLERRPDAFAVELLATGQHRDLLPQALAQAGLRANVEIAPRSSSETLAELLARATEGIARHVRAARPDVVAVQGDTTSALAGALAAFYERVPVAHVEAGLRSGSLAEPFPEEANRRLIDAIAAWLFAPTEHAATVLRSESIATERIFVTGNTVVDALEALRPRLAAHPMPSGIDLDKPLVLVTCHRRETFGEGLRAVCRAVARLCAAYPDHAFVWPVHLNPDVHDVVRGELESLHANLFLSAPLGHLDFLALLSRAKLVLTDSGGVQEEAPSFGVPVVLLRHRTDRPEAVAAGMSVLVGTDEERIVTEASRRLSHDRALRSARQVKNPFGDGHAAERIAETLAPKPA